MHNAREMAALAVQALEDKKGQEIKVLKTADITSLADYFVICTANSSTHIKTLADEVERQLEEQMEERILHREGYRAGGWVLLDYGVVVVHLFMEEAREFYNLERLWADAETVDISALL